MRASTVEDVLAWRAKWATLVGDVRETLRSVPDGCAQTCVTSPPYFGLRDYGAAGQIGQETSPREFVDALVGVMREVRRVLADDGTLWLNIGDSYVGGGGFAPDAPSNQVDRPQTRQRGAKTGGVRACAGLAAKQLVGIPWRLAFALQDDGRYLRSDIVWAKPNPMPESVTDRPTRAHEYVFLLSRRARYFYDADAIREPGTQYTPRTIGRARNVGGRSDGLTTPVVNVATPEAGRNSRDVWTITPEPFDGAHFATMPPALARRCILAGSRRGDIVLDPFGGAATTALAALREGRRAILCELNPEYVEIQRKRLADFDADAMRHIAASSDDFGPLFDRRKA